MTRMRLLLGLAGLGAVVFPASAAAIRHFQIAPTPYLRVVRSSAS
jgi:hypothetical protein